jgi:hypothetical protein
VQGRSIGFAILQAAPALLRGRESNRKIPDFLPMLLTIVDFLEPHKKRPYKPSSRARYLSARNSQPIARKLLTVFSYRRAAALPRLDGNRY